MKLWPRDLFDIDKGLDDDGQKYVGHDVEEHDNVAPEIELDEDRRLGHRIERLL